MLKAHWICKHCRLPVTETPHSAEPLYVLGHHPYLQKKGGSPLYITPIATQVEHLCMVAGDQLFLLLLYFLLRFLPLSLAARSGEE